MMPAKRRSERLQENISVLVRLGVLVWSGALMTAQYIGVAPRGDLTFIASTFSAALSSFGLEYARGKGQTSAETRTTTARRKTTTPPKP